MIEERRETQIAYFGGAWPTNIGNAFVDLGSIQSLKMAAPNSRIHFVSGLPKWLFARPDIQRGSTILRLPRWLFKQTHIKNRSVIERLPLRGREKIKNCFDLVSAMKLDYAVVSGMNLCEMFIKLFGPAFSKLKDKKVKIIINGGGGAHYSEREVSKFRKFLERIKPYAFISRDERSFKNYRDLADYSLNGIDCAFFINDYFTPAKLELPKYVILNFDHHLEPELDIDDRLIIRTHHSCWGRAPKSHFSKYNTLISDLPQDYLNLYANAEEIYSDRVHACVVTLSFGHPCKLYSKTPRASLLDRVGATTIRDKLTYPNAEKIEREKEKQLRFLSNILSS